MDVGTESAPAKEAEGDPLCLQLCYRLRCGRLRHAGPVCRRADTAIESFEALPSVTQAGGHPNFVTRFTLSSHQSRPTACACNDARDVLAHLPTGLIGNPHATPQCGIAEFSADMCPSDPQVGVSYFGVSVSSGSGRFENQDFLAPVYNIVPPPTAPGLLGFKAGGGINSPTFELIGARTDSDYGLDIETRSIEHFAPLTGFEQVTWGAPAIRPTTTTDSPSAKNPSSYFPSWAAMSRCFVTRPANTAVPIPPQSSRCARRHSIQTSSPSGNGRLVSISNGDPVSLFPRTAR